MESTNQRTRKARARPNSTSVPFMDVISITSVSYAVRNSDSESLLILKAMKNYDQNATIVKMRLSGALALVPHPQRSLPNLQFYSTDNTIRNQCTRL